MNKELEKSIAFWERHKVMVIPAPQKKGYIQYAVLEFDSKTLSWDSVTSWPLEYEEALRRARKDRARYRRYLEKLKKRRIG